MVLRGIPPRTSTGLRKPCRRPLRLARPPAHIRIEFPSRKIKEEEYKPKIYKPGIRRPSISKPRQWAYVTKPFFSKIKEPLVDVFKEAQEVQVLIDLGGFAKEEVSFGLKNGKYTVYGKHGEQEFKEVIELPKGVDLDNMLESYKNNILGLVLPRKAASTVGKKREPKRKKSKRRK